MLDFLLMFNNCQIFNEPSSLVGQMGERLDNACRQSMSGMPSEEKEILKKESQAVTNGEVEQVVHPINGQVFPPTTARSDKLVRKTNQLEYIQNIIMNNVCQHKYAWPFLDPVDAVKLSLPVS